MIEAEPHHGVARLDCGEVGGHVCLSAGVGLHVGVVDSEEFFRPLDGQTLCHIDELAAAVVAPSRIALGVLVRHNRTLGLEDGAAGVVF